VTILKTILGGLLALLIGGYTNNANALSLDETRQLLIKTGFAPSFNEIAPYLILTKTQAIDKLLLQPAAPQQPRLPTVFSAPYRAPSFKVLSPSQKKAYRQKLRQQTRLLQVWWLDEMLTTQEPVTENLTLFWHNHFATSVKKVKHPALMAIQNQTFRTHARSNFRRFLHAMIKDPALLLYLDNDKNSHPKSNENLARELMELFTLGEGYYTEADVKNGARALSGYSLKRKTGEFIFYTRAHNNTEKNILGDVGHWNGDDFIDILLQQKQTAQFITGKLWAHYIASPIPPATLTELSEKFYQNYEITPLIKSILQRPEFWSLDNQGTQIKSPIQLVVGLYRQFNIKPDETFQLIRSAKNMGQLLFYPPTVKGWPTGIRWIDSSTLLARQDFVSKATRGMKIKNAVKRYDKPSADWVKLLANTVEQTDLFLDPDPWRTVKATLGDLKYQLQ